MAEKEEPYELIFSEQFKAFWEKVADDFSPEDLNKFEEVISRLVTEGPTIGTKIQTEFGPEEREKFEELKGQEIVKSGWWGRDQITGEMVTKVMRSIEFGFKNGHSLEIFDPTYSSDDLKEKVKGNFEGLNLVKGLKGFSFLGAGIYDNNLEVVLGKDGDLFLILGSAWIIRPKDLDDND